MLHPAAGAALRIPAADPAFSRRQRHLGCRGAAAPHSSAAAGAALPPRSSANSAGRDCAQPPARCRQRRDAGPVHGRIIPLASPYRQRSARSRSRDTSVCAPRRPEGEGRRLGPRLPRGPRAAGREADRIAVPAAGRSRAGPSEAATSLQHVRGRARGPGGQLRSPPAAAGRARGFCPSGRAQDSCPAGGRGCRGPRHRRAEGGREGAGGGCPRPGRTADSRTHLPDWGSLSSAARAGAPPAPLAGGGGARSCLPGAARVPGRAGGAEPAAARGRQRGLDGGGASVRGGRGGGAACGERVPGGGGRLHWPGSPGRGVRGRGAGAGAGGLPGRPADNTAGSLLPRTCPGQDGGRERAEVTPGAH